MTAKSAPNQFSPGFMPANPFINCRTPDLSQSGPYYPTNSCWISFIPPVVVNLTGKSVPNLSLSGFLQPNPFMWCRIPDLSRSGPCYLTKFPPNVINGSSDNKSVSRPSYACFQVTKSFLWPPPSWFGPFGTIFSSQLFYWFFLEF